MPYAPRFVLYTTDASCGPAAAALHAQVWVHHQTAWLALAGALTGDTVDALHRVLLVSRRFPARHLVLDLAELTDIDPDGLDGLRGAHRSLRARFDDIHLIDPPANLAPTVRFLLIATPSARVATRRATVYLGAGRQHTWPMPVDIELPEQIDLFTDSGGHRCRPANDLEVRGSVRIQCGHLTYRADPAPGGAGAHQAEGLTTANQTGPGAHTSTSATAQPGHAHA